MDDYSDLLERLGPEGLQRLMQMGELEAQDADLQAQIAQAQAMRTQQGPERHGALAGGIQAAADILRAYKGKKMEGVARRDRQGVQSAMTAGRAGMANAYFPGKQEPGYAAPLEDFSTAGIPEYLRRQ
jgi:multidrug resistance efflux pump